MFLWIYRLLNRKKTSESIRTFESALSWIEVYIRAQDFEVAQKAVNELDIKLREAQDYHRDILANNEPLTNSNILEVSSKSKNLVSSSRAALIDIQQNMDRLAFFRKKMEKRKIDFDQKQYKQREKTVYVRGKRVIKKYIAEKKYQEAVKYAQRLSLEFKDSHRIFGLLEMAQRSLAKNKDSVTQNDQLQNKVDLMVTQEFGHALKTEDEAIDESNHWWGRWRAYYSRYIAQKHERDTYIERTKNLRTIEDLLRKAGALSLVDGAIDANSEAALGIIQRGTVKDVEGFSLPGFNFEGRILGKDGVIGDTFGFYHRKDRTIFYFGDATGHGVKAGFTVATLSNLFFDNVRDERLTIEELYMELNNQLKGLLKGGMFVTAIFFEYIYASKTLSYIGGGHDPLYVYRSSSRSVERIVAGGLALGVRRIFNLDSIHKKELILDQGDLIFGYTDGIPEARNHKNEMFGFDRIVEFIPKLITSSHRIDDALSTIGNFLHGNEFLDDVSLYFLERNTKRDIIQDVTVFDQILKELEAYNLTSAKRIEFKGKTQEEITEIIKKKKHDEELRIRISKATELLQLGEYTRLKQSVFESYRAGFTHPKFASFLREVVKNEENAVQRRNEVKMKEKYRTLQDLYRKGEYEYVIRECIEVISRNGSNV